MCAYGAAWLKPTSVVGTLPQLGKLERRCPGGLRHVILQGTVSFVENGVRTNCWRTSLAGRYPPRLCRAWAALAEAAAPPAARIDDKGPALSEWWERSLASCQDLPPPDRCVVPAPLVDRRPLEWPRPDRQCWGRSFDEELEIARAHRAGLRHRSPASQSTRPPPRRQVDRLLTSTASSTSHAARLHQGL